MIKSPEDSSPVSGNVSCLFAVAATGRFFAVVVGAVVTADATVVVGVEFPFSVGVSAGQQLQMILLMLKIGLQQSLRHCCT